MQTYYKLCHLVQINRIYVFVHFGFQSSNIKISLLKLTFNRIRIFLGFFSILSNVNGGKFQLVHSSGYYQTTVQNSLNNEWTNSCISNEFFMKKNGKLTFQTKKTTRIYEIAFERHFGDCSLFKLFQSIVLKLNAYVAKNV